MYIYIYIYIYNIYIYIPLVSEPKISKVYAANNSSSSCSFQFKFCNIFCVIK